MVNIRKISKFVKDPKKVIPSIRYKVSKTSSKVLYQNELTLEKNLNAIKTIEIMKQVDPRSTIQKFDNDFTIEFKKNGYARMGCPYDDGLISSIKKKYDKMIEDDRYSFAPNKKFENQVYHRMLFRAFELIPEVKQLINEKIFKALEGYHGNFQVTHVQMKRHYHVPPDIASKTEMYANYWHNDDQADWYDDNGRMISTSKLFINLSKITEQDGPIHIHSKEKTKKLLDMGFKSRYNYNLPKEIIEDPDHVVKGVGPPGTTLWATTRYCLHRADIPAPGHHRDVIHMQIKSSDEPLKDDWPNQCVNLNSENRFKPKI